MTENILDWALYENEYLTNENIFLKDEVENLRYNLNNLTKKI